MARASAASLIGSVVLGRYRIVRPLARGGMGVVYLGRVEGAAGFAKPVVIKTVLSHAERDSDAERLFAREARIVASLQHPGIVAVVDFGTSASLQIMVLEYVHGYNLGQWLRFALGERGEVPVRHAVHVVSCVVDALAFAHGLTGPDGAPLGIVHRDISPGNVLIDAQGHVKLTDFGIARMADETYKTQQGTFRGTLPFMAPESLEGDTVNPRSDQYACAVLLYTMLAGKNPFKGNELSETLARVLRHVPPGLSSLRRDVLPELEQAVARALSKDPTRRFDSAKDFSRAVRDACPWPEREAAEAFSAEIERDFADPKLAEWLGVESLAARDASWREAQDAPARVSLSSSPPGLGAESETVTLHEPEKTFDTLDLPAKATKAPSKKTALWIALAALAAGAGSAGVMLALSGRTGEPASRVVVIEKREDAPERAEPASPSPSPSPAQAASALATEPGSSPAASAPSRPAQKVQAPPGSGQPASAANRGGTLARAFQRQQGKIQGCFAAHPQDAPGAEISVRFQIDASGAVENAAVRPPALASTGLGQCLVGVARATQFGPQPEPVAFAIPIATRVIQR